MEKGGGTHEHLGQEDAFLAAPVAVVEVLLQLFKLIVLAFSIGIGRNNQGGAYAQPSRLPFLPVLFGNSRPSPARVSHCLTRSSNTTPGF
jgi:hypothetical protein